jgi:histidyl-tRNA synthetase
MRILDSKAESTQALLNDAPDFHDYLDDESLEHFDVLKSLLDKAGIAYEVNPRLVRGLDYYCKTVFEWVTDKLGSQGTVCAGGRYDGLVEQLGGKATPAVGFAMGIERLVLLLETLDAVPAAARQTVDVYIASMGADAAEQSLLLAEQLRHDSDLRIQLQCGGGSFKSQMKKADRSGAAVALILGDDEVARGVATLKPLRREAEQIQVSWSQLATELTTIINA